MSDRRRAELADNLARVRRRIADACAAAGRAAGEVRLVAVTKTFPAADVALLADLGQDCAGENRDQEAGPKAAEVARLRPHAALRWEMVGQLQTNKARSAARWATAVQSVDSARLVDALDRAAGTALDRGHRQAPMEVLVQARVARDPARGGCPLDELEALADRVAAAGHLRLTGMMGMAPLGGDPARAFAMLSGAASRLRANHPGAVELSAGMSGDLEAAIQNGSTCVRVGTALLGNRPLTSPAA